MMLLKQKFILLSLVSVTIQSTLFSHGTIPPRDITTAHSSKNSSKHQTLIEISGEGPLHTALTSNTPMVILGYAPGCIHCTIMREALKKAANLPINKNVNFATVNGIHPIANQPTAEPLHTRVAKLTNNTKKINGYPATLFINRGSIQDLSIGAYPDKLQPMIASLIKAPNKLQTQKSIVRTFNKKTQTKKQIKS